MRNLDATGLTPEILARVAAVWDATDDRLAALVQVGVLDPTTDFRHLDLRGWELRGEDVRGFDFTGADLRQTGIEEALWDETTILAGAILDSPTSLVPSASARARTNAKLRKAQRARPAAPEGGYTKVRIPNLSDAELVDRIFVIDDPLALDNITSAAPPTDEWLTYEGRYEVGTSVTCAFAHRHKRGYVFRDEQGRHYLIGHECGAKHLGLGNWQSFTTGREQLEDRASSLRLIRDLADAFRRHRDWIAGLPQDPAIRAFDELRRQLVADLPELVAAATAATARSDGMLAIPVRVRDYAAEERRREREAQAREWYAGQTEAERMAFHAKGGRVPGVDRTPIITRGTYALGTLQGRSVFSSTPALSLGMRQLLPLIDRFLEMPRTPTTRKGLVEVTRNAKELVNRLLRAQASIDDATAFFEQGNLERVARWADAHGFEGRRYAIRSGHIEVEKADGGFRQSLARPPALKALDPAPFEALKAAVGRISDRVDKARLKKSGPRTATAY